MVSRHIHYIAAYSEIINANSLILQKDHKFCGECGSSICIDMLGDEAVGKFLNKPGTDFLAVNVSIYLPSFFPIN